MNHLARKYVVDLFANDDRVGVDPIILAEIAYAVENYEPDPLKE